MTPIIEFKDYTFKYRSQVEPTLYNIDLAVYPGEKVLIEMCIRDRYYRVHDPIVEGEETENEEQIQEKILAGLRMTGVVNADENIVASLDGAFGTKSDVIPVERKKDGSFSARSSILQENDFRVISDYVNLKIREIGTGILNGNIELNPYIQGSGQSAKDACTYCPYSRVCGFDRKIPGFRKRELEAIPEEEALRKMEEALNSSREGGRS